MRLDAKLKKQVDETRYLSTDNTWRYRTIIRIMYDSYEKMRNYQDYVSRFYSPKSEEMMKTTEFLLYKEGFIGYLRDFIRGLQINSLLIREILKNVTEEDIEKLIQSTYEYEKGISAQEIKEEEYKDINKGRFSSIREWFLSYNNRAPLIEQLIDNTNEIIRRITRSAAQIADKRGNSANRKEEYRKLASIFDKCESMNEAHHKNSGELREFNSKIVHIFEDNTENSDLELVNKRRRIDISCRVQGKEMVFNGLIQTINRDIEELKLLINTEERRIFEEVLLNTIRSSKISAKIYLSRQWVDKINSLMEERDTSSGLTLSLKWISKKAEREDQLDIAELLDMLERGGRANDEDMKKLAGHFGDKVKEAIRSYEETGEARNYQSIIKDVLDYRKWFEFKLFYTKKNERKRELTNNAFFQFSGGEKAMSMYIPLFSAVYARYENARNDCPRIIAMDEAFAGVDENNIRDMFKLLKDLKLDYVLNSQILWGDYDTVDNLSICELIREENDDIVSVIRYHWNGIEKICLV